MNNIIRADKITKTYKLQFPFKKIEAVKSVTFSVEENQIFGLLGPNGAGKSTTLKMMMGIIKPTTGSVAIFNSVIDDKNVRKRIGFLPENPSFYPFLTAYETLDFIGGLFGIPKESKQDRIKTLIGLVGLKDAMNNPVGTFSKGMAQRLGMAQALINDPEIIILDEPMSGLDPIGRKEMKDIILMMKRRGKTIIFSSHILPDIEILADKVCVINKGIVVGIGYIQDIIKRELKEIELELISNEKINSLLEKYKDDCRFFSNHENKIFITTSNAETAEQIMQLVKENNGRVISYIPRESKLEDYFMNLMKD
ncbi:MAG: ABC transporter ATP-binding protein [bacterium]